MNKAIPILLPGTGVNGDIRRVWKYKVQKKKAAERTIKRKMLEIQKAALMRQVRPFPYKKIPKLAPASRFSMHVNINKLQLADSDYYNPNSDQYPLVREQVHKLLKLGFSRDVIEKRLHVEFVRHHGSFRFSGPPARFGRPSFFFFFFFWDNKL